MDRAHLRTQVLRWSGGFVSLVVGVLLALAADAWWQEREAARRTRVYLEMLRTDLRGTASLIQQNLAFNQKAAENAARMANALLAADTWDRLPKDVTPYFEYDQTTWFNTGTIGALLSTGDINNIRSDVLRSAIVRYAGELESIRGELTTIQTFIWNNVSEYTRHERALFESSKDPVHRRRLMSMLPPAALRSFELSEIRKHPEIQAAFRLHAVAVGNRVAHLQRAAKPVNELIALLDRELGPPPDGPTLLPEPKPEGDPPIDK
jgi:hypothetical protein